MFFSSCKYLSKKKSERIKKNLHVSVFFIKPKTRAQMIENVMNSKKLILQHFIKTIAFFCPRNIQLFSKTPKNNSIFLTFF